MLGWAGVGDELPWRGIGGHWWRWLALVGAMQGPATAGEQRCDRWVCRRGTCGGGTPIDAELKKARGFPLEAGARIKSLLFFPHAQFRVDAMWIGQLPRILHISKKL